MIQFILEKSFLLLEDEKSLKLLNFVKRDLLVYKMSTLSYKSESCGLAVEHSAHDQKVAGSIPSNARWKWCQSYARIYFYTQFWFIIEK